MNESVYVKEPWSHLYDYVKGGKPPMASTEH